MEKEVNNCGLACPQPVINTKKALDEINSGVVVSIVDNEVAKENVTRFVQNAGHQVDVKKSNDNYMITITKGEGQQVNKSKDNITITNTTQSNIVYLITTDALGQGSPDLGYTLMKSFFTAIKETAPAILIFMNTGVKLACKDYKTIEDLMELQEKGTEILACGTCLDYYKIRENLAVGKISNMFEIVNAMESGKVITVP
ncbi:MAG: sulfurtransferase-like selenium metabolism protein YedF [Firmicutes bacterium]|nr:sulfurtransferase-like selenium metabolism protein YedF [Bacillota bacterium]